jgi:geranylgeranyl pyrophosphate synthase
MLFTEVEKIAKVKNFYMELKLIDYFKAFEEETYNEISLKIQQTSNDFPKQTLIKMLDLIVKRYF